MRSRLVWVPGYLSFRKWAVVYYLHGQTGRSTVWENGNQNLGLVNVVTESRLPFVQISYFCRKTATKAWNWYKRWLWRNGTWIPSWKTGLPFQRFRCSRKFSVGTTQKVMLHLLANPIFRKLFVNGKQPLFAPPPPPPSKKKSSPNHCFQFLLGSTVDPRGKEDNGYVKFGGVNKVYKGLCQNGELLWQKSKINPYKNGAKFCDPTFCKKVGNH